MSDSLRESFRIFAAIFGLRIPDGYFRKPYPACFLVRVTRTKSIGNGEVRVHFVHLETGTKGFMIRSWHDARMSSAVGSSFYVRCLCQYGKPVFDASDEYTFFLCINIPSPKKTSAEPASA